MITIWSIKHTFEFSYFSDRTQFDQAHILEVRTVGSIRRKWRAVGQARPSSDLVLIGAGDDPYAEPQLVLGRRRMRHGFG